MKRHRFFNLYLDMTRNALRHPEATPEFIEQESAQMRKSLAVQFGEDRIEEKFERYMELSPPQFCAMFDYHAHSRQIGDAYVSGHDFPALTGACCLGERIFNLLIHELRDLHKASPLYKKVYRTGSFQDWDFAIEVLREWKLAPDPVLAKIEQLKGIRHQAVHYGEIRDLRAKAKQAVQLALEITDGLFGMREDVFFWAPGEPYIKKERESDPFVQKFLIPACPPVGFKHWMSVDSNMRWTIHDVPGYEEREVTDDEFVRLRTEWHARQVPKDGGQVSNG